MISSCLLTHATYPSFERKINSWWKTGTRILNKHTDLISSGGILALTTCLLAAKIFPQVPMVLPRLSSVILNFGGIIWLNVQVRDVFKCARDFFAAIKMKEFSGFLLTSVKVFVKAVDTLLTCGLFTASMVAFCGFPQATILIYQSIRPLAISSLLLGITTEISNYFVNEHLLEKLRKIDQIDRDGRKIENVMRCFINGVFCHYRENANQILAMHIIRQLDTQTLETFQERFMKKFPVKGKPEEAVPLFYAMRDSLQNKQAATKANLFLISLGYICMGLCKIFPGSLVEISLRWGMSVLYTDELIKQKFFQAKLASQISA